MSNYQLEYSPNNNDICTNCNQQIKIGDCRYGTFIDKNQFPTEWKHFNCIQEDQKNQLFNDLPSQDINSLRKFSSLTDDEKITIVTLMENIIDTDEVKIPKLISRKLIKEDNQEIIDISSSMTEENKMNNTNKRKLKRLRSINYQKKSESKREKVIKLDYQRKTNRQKVQKPVKKLPNSCEICGKIFKRHDNRNRHMRIHTGERPFECETCGKCFSQKCTLTKHIRIHTGEKPFACELCEKAFNQKSDLGRHMFVHSGLKPFECETCGRPFSQKSDLKNHCRIHTGVRPYECDVCHKTFVQRNSLNKHLLIHTGEKPYKCKHCNKRFNQNSNLYTHIDHHHFYRNR